MIKNSLKKIYVALIFVFLYAPILTLIVLSFNSSKTRAKWGGFTVKWYGSLFKNAAIMGALWNTILIAVIASVVSTIIGTITCIAIYRMTKKQRSLILGVTNIPMLNAEIVTGISLMLLFLSLGFKFGLGTIILAHITFCIPYVILSVMPRMSNLNPYTYEAALDLGAGPIEGYVKVVLPELVPGIASGFLMAFTMSIDDFIITHFTKGAGVDTLSTKIYTEVKKGIKPEMYALSTIIFVTVLILLLLVNYSPSNNKPQKVKKITKQEGYGGEN